MMYRAFIALAALAALTGAAAAHAFLQHATPGAGASLASAPKDITLGFSEPLEPAFSGVNVTNAAGNDVEAAPPAITGPTMKVTLKPLAPGVYHVTWHAVSVDTHRTDGDYRFTVKP